jgi:hypothetical protein
VCSTFGGVELAGVPESVDYTHCVSEDLRADIATDGCYFFGVVCGSLKGADDTMLLKLQV